MDQLDLNEPKLSIQEAHFYIDEHFVAYAEALVNLKAKATKTTLIKEDIRSYFFDEIDPAHTPF